MTEQEAEIKRVISYIRSCRDAGIDTTITIDKNKSHFILNALEEIRQYRNGKLCLIPDVVFRRQCEELDKYKALGTLEELREAADREWCSADYGRKTCKSKLRISYRRRAAAYMADTKLDDRRKWTDAVRIVNSNLVEVNDMDAERMIRELRKVGEQHANDNLMTGQLNITAMCMDVISKLEILKQYEDTGLTPEQIREIDRLYAEKCRELVECQKKQQQDWIPVSERLPEGEYRVLITDGYMVTVGWLGRYSQEWYTGLIRWSEKYRNSVLAWMPLPETYQPKICTDEDCPYNRGGRGYE